MDYILLNEDLRLICTESTNKTDNDCSVVIKKILEKENLYFTKKKRIIIIKIKEKNLINLISNENLIKLDTNLLNYFLVKLC